MDNILLQIRDFGKLILNNDITFFVIVPFLLQIFSWIKSARDIKSENKEKGYWIKKYEKRMNYVDFTMKAYRYIGLIFLVALILYLFIAFYINLLVADVISISFYLSLSYIWCICLMKSTTLKHELLEKGKIKKKLLIYLYSIFTITFLLATIECLFGVSEMFFIIALIIWAIILLKEYEVIYEIENRYVDIWVQGSGLIERIYTNSIKKKGVWIIAKRKHDGKEENIYIRESNIIQSKYYGEPDVVKKRVKLFGKTMIVT